MYNKEGVARCHADRQPTERPTRARGTRGRQTSTVNFISFFRRCSVFRSFAISPTSMWNYRYYPLYLFHLFTSRTFLLRLILTSLQITYDWYVWSARSEISFDHPSFTIFWDAIKILGLWRLRDAEEERKEGCKRPIRYPIRGWEECPPLPWQLGKHPTDV